MKTDIVFIHPANHKKSYQQLANEFTAIAPPVWTLLLAGHCQKKNYSVAIHDTNVNGWSEQIAKEVLSGYNPELIVVLVYGHNPSASTQTMPAATHIIHEIKKAGPDYPVAIGGLHPTALPEQTLRETGADYVIRGEGAAGICSLLKWQQGKIKAQNLVGITYTDKDGGMVHCQPPALIEDLDSELGSYPWELIPSPDQYRAHNSHTLQYFHQSRTPDFSDSRSPYAVLYTSLGCPYNCNYCCINKLFGQSRIRYWSLDTVLGWIDTLVSRYHIKHIRFDDELFVLNADRVERFCDSLIERNYDLNLWAYSRVDTIQPGLLAKMKTAGFNWLCLGIESAHEDVRRDVNKNIRGDIKEVVHTIQSHGIHVLGNYMFGLPNDTRASMQATLDLAMALKCEFSNFYCTMAYPGSKLYDHWACVHPESLPSEWNSFSQHSYDCLPLPTKQLRADEVLAFRDQAFDRYFTSDAYLTMIEKTFGGKALSHIQRMTRIKLSRKILESSRSCVKGPRKK